MSFLSVAERLAAIDRSSVSLTNNGCLHTQDRFSTCTACFDVCPTGAITPSKPPVLITENCQTCLACLPSCPTGAYTADDVVATLLNCTGRLENNTLELVCERHPAAQQGVQKEAVGVCLRGCLAGLGTGTYMILAALGLEQIVVRTDACGTCLWGALRDKIESQVSQARRLLAPWDKAHTVRCLPVLENPVERPLWQADNPPLSRRDLFRLAARQGQVAMARAMENDHMTSEHQPSRDRRRILGAVAHFPDLANTATSLAGMDFAWLSVNEACTACGVCGRVCPTGALRFEKSEDHTSYTLTFSARNCMGCEMCVHVCAPEAISVNHEPTFDTVFGTKTVTLRDGELARCVQCKALFAAHPDAHLCPQCEYRRSHPFGSMLPPGIKFDQSHQRNNAHDN